MNRSLRKTYTRLYIIDMTIANRLDEAMKDAGIESQSALYRASDVPQPTINRILKGVGKKGPETQTIEKLATACGVNFKWLHEGIGPKSRNSKIDQTNTQKNEIDLFNNPEFPAIRRVNLRLSAGMTGFSVDYEDGEGDMIVFKRRWYDMHGYKPEKLIAIRVQGQSMESGMYQDDTVVVNTADTELKDGEVFAINYEGEAVVKRMIRDRGEWWLSSDNPDQNRYPRKVCSGDACLVIGRVVHKQSEKI